MLCIWGLVERNSDLVMSLMSMLRNVFGPQSVADPKHYRLEVWTICYHYFLQAELRFSLLLILMVGPNLISADMRLMPCRSIFPGRYGALIILLGSLV